MDIAKLYDQLFDIKTLDEKVFKIQIVSSSSPNKWYSSHIGRIYTVIEEDDYLRLIKLVSDSKYYKDSFFINKTDAIIIT